MASRQLIAALAVAAAGFAGPAIAQEGTRDFEHLFKMAAMDKDKDGMVSKKEFIAMMEKAYDMKAKEMDAKKGLISEAQMRQLLKSLYAGG